MVANQWTVTNGKSTKRADIVVFINGLPISVVELKSPSREVTNSEEAHQQLQNYMRIVPQLFTACQMLVISDMADTRVGTITAPLDRYMEWKPRMEAMKARRLPTLKHSSTAYLRSIGSLI